MLALILIFLAWVVLPVIVYRVVSYTSGSVLLPVTAAAISVLIAVVGLEFGFHVSKAFLRKLRRRDTLS
jgi:hypothetical protein